MDCVLIAGGVPQSDDPLYPFAQGKPKSLIEIGGKPMAQWVVDALTSAPDVDEIIVVGVTPDTDLISAKIAHYYPDQGSLLSNGLAGIDWLLDRRPTADRVLISCADIPLLKPEMITWLIEKHKNRPTDLNYTVIPRPKMETAFPTSDRTYSRFENMDVAGGDIHVSNPHIFRSHQELWHKLAVSRKESLKAALRLGPGIFIKFFLHRLSTVELEARVQQRLNIRLRVLPAPYPELGMDVDKPHQLEICRRMLEGTA
jgi:GTP:adenosylcobinamide-phosphate guanylyltransferase